MNLFCSVVERETRLSSRNTKNIKKALELKAALEHDINISYHHPEPRISTFVIAFSHDRTKIATTHGNHTVQVSNCYTCKVEHVLRGHIRTPWSVSFHGFHSFLLASGCLGGEVRLWNLKNKEHNDNVIYQSVTVIASLAFHPVEDVLLITTFNELIFVNWNTRHELKSIRTRQPQETIRFVRFIQQGQRLLTGIYNVDDSSCKAFQQNAFINGVFQEDIVRRNNSVVTKKFIPRSHRLQLWDLNGKEYPEIYRTVSSDGRMIAYLVPNCDDDDIRVEVVSLRPENYLQCEYSRKYGPNASSLSFSPMDNYLMVGFQSRTLHRQITSLMVIAQILKLPRRGNILVDDYSKPASNVRLNFKEDNERIITVNSICFHPEPGMGIIYGTNCGHVHHRHIGNSTGVNAQE